MGKTRFRGKKEKKSSITTEKSRKINKHQKKNSKKTNFFCFFSIIVLGLSLIIGASIIWYGKLIQKSKTNKDYDINTNQNSQTDPHHNSKMKVWSSLKDDTTILNSGKWMVPCQGIYIDKTKKKKCAPSRCGRIIIDDFISAHEVEQLIKMMDFGLSFGDGGAGGPSILDLASGAVSFGRKFLNVYGAMKENASSFSKDHINIVNNIIKRIKSTVAKSFKVKGHMLTQPNFFTRITVGKAKIPNDEYWHVHDDTKQYQGFCFTSLLYLNTLGEDYDGGKFVFVDGDIHRYVSPVKGRLVIFTSGKENLHHITEVTKGFRRAFTIAFTCDSQYSVKKYR